jgi:hypothetical protein
MQPDLILFLVMAVCLVVGVIAAALRYILHWSGSESAVTPQKAVGGAEHLATNGSESERSLTAEGRRWLLVGAPGTGKSTAARALIRVYLGIGTDVTVLDPDGSAWPAGARMVGAPDDYPAIGEALTQLQSLAGDRRAQFHRGVRVFEPVLVVIDEAPSVLRSTPGAIDTVADLARRGRKLAISIVLLCQDTQAKTLGLEGQTKLLSAFDRLDCRMTPAGVELLDGDVVRTVAPLDYDADDLVLPLVEAVAVAPAAPIVARPTRIESVEQVDANRILRDALGIDGRNGETSLSEGVSGVAVSQMESEVLVSNRDETNVSRPELTQMLPPDVLKRISSIDWYTVALAVEGGIAETMMLKSLGYPPGSTAKYQVARERLQAARAALREVSAKG